MKKLQNWIIVAVVLVFVIFGGVLLANRSTDTGTDRTQPIQEEQVKKVEASVSIKFGGDQEDVSAKIEIKEGQTALELTKKVVEVITSGEGEMAFVTTIGGTKADAAKNEFWELLINGESAQVGAGSYEVKDSDKISWQISTF